MGAVEQRGLDWIERAPFSFTGSVMTKASPDAVFAVLADHEHWPDWFPIIKKTVVVGTAREGAGMRRYTLIPGGRLDELFIAWDPGKRLAFTITAVSPGILHGLVDDCLIQPTSNGTHVTYTSYLDPVAPLLPILKLVNGLLNRQLANGMRALADLAERR